MFLVNRWQEVMSRNIFSWWEQCSFTCKYGAKCTLSLNQYETINQPVLPTSCSNTKKHLAQDLTKYFKTWIVRCLMQNAKLPHRSSSLRNTHKRTHWAFEYSLNLTFQTGGELTGISAWLTQQNAHLNPLISCTMSE